MIDKGMQDGVYEKIEKTHLKRFKAFSGFLVQKLQYNDMLPSSNQPIELCGTEKTHNFNDVNDIAVESLKFRPIIAQTGT